MAENSMVRIEEVLLAIRRVIRATDLYSRQLVKTTGLTTPQILLLQSISLHGEATLGELAKEVSLSQATTITILDRLEARELIYRERSPKDKRKVHAHLTEKAKEVLRQTPLPLQKQFKRQFTNLEDWEQTMILSSLQRVATMMDADDLDAAPVLDVGTLDRPENTSE